MHWFDILIIVIILAALVKGFMSGLVMQVASLAGIVIGAIFAGQLSGYVAPKLLDITNVSPHILSPLSYIVAFLLIFVVLILIGRIINKFVTAIQLGFVNRSVGAAFSAAKWLVIFSIVLNLLVELDSNTQILKEDTLEKTHTYPLVKSLAPTIIPFLKFQLQNVKPSAVELEESISSLRHAQL